jgi:hypothetical protein
MDKRPAGVACPWSRVEKETASRVNNKLFLIMRTTQGISAKKGKRRDRF